MSLLTRALSETSNQQRKNNITQEEIELAVAWIKDKVGIKQMTKVVGKKMNYAWILLRIREAYRKGLIK